MFFDYNDVSFNARQNLLNYLTPILGGGAGVILLSPPLSVGFPLITQNWVKTVTLVFCKIQ